MRKRFFEVSAPGVTVYVASSDADPAKVKAAAIRRLADMGHTDIKPSKLVIYMTRGMRPKAFAERWVLNFDDLDETISDMREDLVRYPDIATPVTPAGLRANIEEFPDPLWYQLRCEWPQTMRLLGKDTPDRATFDRTFDRLIAKRMASGGGDE